MNTMDVSRSLRFLRVSSEVLGLDATHRMAITFMAIAEAGDDGVEQATIQKLTESAQSSTSRNLKVLCNELKLGEFFLDPADGRRRLVRLTRTGKAAAAKITGVLAK